MKNILEYKRALSLVGTAFIGVSGVCWGYVYANAELEASFNDRVEAVLAAELEKTRRFYATMYKDVEPEDVSDLHPDAVVDEQHIVIPKEALNTPEGRAAVMEQLAKVVDPPEVEESEVDEVIYGEDDEEVVFVNVDEEALLAERSPETPYVVSAEEFNTNSGDYEVIDLTFFEQDGILIDEEDDIIPDSDGVVGDKNLQRFGLWSGNNNVVFVANERSETLFRVTRNFTSYAEAVYGVADEEEGTLQHSSMRRSRSRRDD